MTTNFVVMNVKHIQGHNDNQTVIVKMSSSYSIFKMSIPRVSSKTAMESPQSVHLCDVARSFLCHFPKMNFSENLKRKNL